MILQALPLIGRDKAENCVIIFWTSRFWKNNSLPMSASSLYCAILNIFPYDRVLKNQEPSVVKCLSLRDIGRRQSRPEPVTGGVDKKHITDCGRGQVVRHQPSKLIFAGPNPVARSKDN
jgi:hypothetical protein